MKIFLSLILSLLVVTFTYGQSIENQQDLDFLYSKIIKLPSYKDQFNKKEKDNFKQKLDSLKLGTQDDSDLEFYLKLYSLLEPIKDNHLGLYSNPELGKKIYINSIPLKINRDSLLNIASQKPENSVEGLYKLSGDQFIIIKDADFYKILSLKNEKITQFALLRETAPNHFDFIFNDAKGIIILGRNYSYSNKRLTNTPFKKYLENDYVNIQEKAEKFGFKKINDTLTYLRLGTFDTSNENLATSTKFYSRIKDSLQAKHIIVDLRNNGGGGFKTSRVYLKLLKRHQGNIHIIINKNTVSNAEQFALKFKGYKNATLYGETTKGTIAYGNNSGTTFTLPSGRFVFYPTDMNTKKKYLQLENIGIKPDVLLDPFSKDWVEQVIDKINGK